MVSGSSQMGVCKRAYVAACSQQDKDGDSRNNRWIFSSSVTCKTGGHHDSQTAIGPEAVPYRRLWSQGLKCRARSPAATSLEIGHLRQFSKLRVELINPARHRFKLFGNLVKLVRGHSPVNR